MNRIKLLPESRPTFISFSQLISDAYKSGIVGKPFTC